jgi:ACS family 4-hydroxyphenylacetate permease-like MFS transporter
MTVLSSAPTREATDPSDPVVRKVFRRLMWFLFVLLVVAFIDRINIGFAALTMNRDLGLSAAAFGASITVFYAAYALCEIPSNLALARFGARVWIARIMITWGLASAATAFAVGMWSLYGLRLLVGVAEAGFQPGMFLYITYWFPQAYRARANAVFIMGAPVTIAIASTMSGFILGMDGFLGLAGWRWLFLLEGLPAVILGILCFFYLVDGPAQARWLSAADKARCCWPDSTASAQRPRTPPAGAACCASSGTAMSC